MKAASNGLIREYLKNRDLTQKVSTFYFLKSHITGDL